MLQNVFNAFFVFIYFKPHLFCLTGNVAVILFLSLIFQKTTLVIGRVGGM